MDCLRFLFGEDAITMFEGTNVVWKQGPWVFKYPTMHSVAVFENEITTIRSVPPGFADAVGLVEATVMTVPSRMTLPAAADGRGHSLIRMPSLAGVEAYTLVGRDDFPGISIAAAVVQHCRRIQELGYANTDLKLENTILMFDTTVKFVDWGGVCRLDSPPPRGRTCSTTTLAWI